MVLTPNDFLGDIIRFVRDDLRTNITDPLNRAGGIEFIMTAYPKRKVQYPIVTLKITGSSTQKLGMQSEVNLVNVTLEIRLWAKNAKQSDQITAEIIDRLRDLQYDASGTDNEEIFGFKLNSMTPVVEEIGEDNLIHSKVMEFLYSAILT